MTAMAAARPGRASEEPWHLLDSATAAERLSVDPAMGLAGDEAADRLERHGPNRLPVAATRSPWLLFLDQFRNFLIVVLIGAAVLAGVVGDVKDTVVIAVVLVFNALARLHPGAPGRAEPRRAWRGCSWPTLGCDGAATTAEIAAEVLVPGDLVLLEAGDRVPADGRLIAAHGAEFDESSLTGESTPVTKQTEPLTSPTTAIADRSNLAFMNTVVTRGRIEMLVTATGSATEVGPAGRDASDRPEADRRRCRSSSTSWVGDWRSSPAGPSGSTSPWASSAARPSTYSCSARSRWPSPPSPKDSRRW